MHLLHVGIRASMHRATMNVVSKLKVLQDKHADVRHGAQIYVVTHFVLNKTLVDKRVKDPLYHSWKIQVVLI